MSKRDEPKPAFCMKTGRPVEMKPLNKGASFRCPECREKIFVGDAE